MERELIPPRIVPILGVSCVSIFVSIVLRTLGK
jgi:hypothetical protein